MKYDFDFSQRPDYILIKTGGFDVVEDFYNLLKDLFASPNWTQGTALIIDHRYLDLKVLTLKQIKMIFSILEFHADQLAETKCAFIIDLKGAALVNDLLNRMDQTSTIAVKFFTDPQSAKQWLSD
ncbi:hypothetical protein SAMN05660420_01898 [Desulfuromusa kysingii]|uniref:SpoIIAA-like n=1 Tax=Desulfuromusa kysingii TaxID=37625 RepID=A0A1H4ALW9_9BACT|nr:hypothetical protein [Desulfuromusa kysingii]SEA36930.1 hypothetical protein SAMN05660420_01898 [Desulfuromusa kysingii]